MQRWCCSRRDTRGKRGYDGSGAREWQETGRVAGRRRGVMVVLFTSRYPRQARV